MPEVPACHGLEDCAAGLARTLVFDDFKTLFYSNAPWYSRGLAFVGIAGNVFFVLKLAKLGKIAVVLGRAGKAVDEARIAGEGDDLATAAERAWSVPGCTPCFPAGITVAARHGTVAIERLTVGDTVLSEDPMTGTVEPERVLAVLDDGVKPLIALDLSDGSRIRATANHVFWVDRGPRLRGSGWLQAGQLRPGDVLRTASGGHVRVAAVHWNQGDAPVYTLTVASDHTFFVGTARVLVHNADLTECLSAAKDLIPEATDLYKTQANSLKITVFLGVYRTRAGELKRMLTINNFYGRNQVLLGQLNMARARLQDIAVKRGWEFRGGEYDATATKATALHAEDNAKALVEGKLKGVMEPDSVVTGAISTSYFCDRCLANYTPLNSNGLKIDAGSVTIVVAR